MNSIPLLVLCTFMSWVARQDDRRPLPSEAAQRESEALIRDVFKDEYAKTAPADRQSLAKKLIDQGLETKDDPAAQYVLFREARDLAAQAGDANLAFRAVDEAAKVFRVDAAAMKNEAIGLAAKNAKTPTEFKNIAQIYLKLAEDSVLTDNYDAAIAAARSAADFAKRAKDLGLATKAESRAKELAQLKSSFEGVKAARERLKRDPADAEACTSVGRFLCFVKDDWTEGIPLLAKGSDAELKSLATKEMTKPTDASIQASIGDGWWELAEKETPPAKGHLRKRACHWYSEAVERLTGLTKTKVERRLSELGVAGKKDVWVEVGHVLDLRGQPGKGDNKYLKEWPPGEFDGVSVRVRLDKARLANGGVGVEDGQRMFYIVGPDDSLVVATLDQVNTKWIADVTAKLPRRDDYVLTVMISGGTYVVTVDGEEKGRVRTAATKLTTLAFQADHAAVFMDQLKLHKKKP